MSPLLLQLQLHKVLEKYVATAVAAAVAVAVAVKQNSKFCRIFFVKNMLLLDIFFFSYQLTGRYMPTSNKQLGQGQACLTCSELGGSEQVTVTVTVHKPYLCNIKSQTCCWSHSHCSKLNMSRSHCSRPVSHSYCYKYNMSHSHCSRPVSHNHCFSLTGVTVTVPGLLVTVTVPGLLVTVTVPGLLVTVTVPVLLHIADMRKRGTTIRFKQHQFLYLLAREISRQGTCCWFG